ncbi:MAG: PSD1 and planctomycete cytochrome C domain-containing protein [Planctomycetota bacterium]|nr:PSD1 and planctomycete cytochrome C domain-containing protein [Planctomycetota bacterium]
MRKLFSGAIAQNVAAIAAMAWIVNAGIAQKNEPVDFAHNVAPIIRLRCAECHTSGKYKGAFSMDTREDMLKSMAIKPGKSATSELIGRVVSDKPDHRMPPKGDRLTSKQVDLLKAWIDQGLPWEPGYSFKTSSYLPPLEPRKVALPASIQGREHPIDRILDVYHARNKQKEPDPLDDRAFLRRVYLDLVGQLPTPAESEKFLAESPLERRALAIKRLLADPRPYTDHWLTFWNDLLRNDYAGTGFIDGGRKQISAWLYQALLDNKPYDKMARELISPNADSDGFIHGIKWRGNVNASQVVELQFSQNISQVFFGVNMKCASCHDSFIDTWKLDDAYSLAAVISNSPLEIHRCDKPQGRKAAPSFLFPQLGTIDASQPRDKRLAQLAKLVTHEKNGRFSRTMANRVWQRLMGRGIVHPVDVMANPPFDADLLDYLGSYLADNQYDLKKLMLHIVSSRAYQSRPALQENGIVGGGVVFRGPGFKRMSAEQFLDAIWQVTATGGQNSAAPVKLPAWTEITPKERQGVRVSLMNADALTRSLGRPNREQVVTTRPDQLTTLQAIDLANGKEITQILASGAAALRKAHPATKPVGLIVLGYERALGRQPTSDELQVATDIIGSKPTDDSVADLLWTIFMLPEFQIIR